MALPELYILGNQLTEYLETDELSQGHIVDLEESLSKTILTSEHMRDLEKLYTSAIVHKESKIIDLIDSYIIKFGLKFKESDIITHIYYCGNRKQRRILRNE